MEDMTTIKFDAPYKPKIEEPGEFRESLFSESYKTAYDMVQSIIENQQSKVTDHEKAYEGMVYNIVPFIGERGSGKTSVMLSFRKYLGEYKNSADFWTDNIDKENEDFNLGNIKFITIEPIDVGHLEKCEDLLGVVLARMLGYYNSLLNKTSRMTTHNRSSVYSRFSDIYNSLENIGNFEKNPDLMGRSALKVLQDLDASQNLKASFMKLVKEFISAVCELETQHEQYYECSNAYVVISIDDLDMNIDNAYKIMEQIQSYMMIPNVIVLMTASYDNLVCICINHYASFFKEVIHASSRAKTLLDRRFLDSCEDLAHEYLNKFLPVGKIIHLNHQHDNNIKMRLDDLKSLGIFLDNSDDHKKAYVLYGDFLKAVIFSATGMYLYANSEKRCFLEPESIRAKAQYFHKIKKLRPVLKSEWLKGAEINVYDNGNRYSSKYLELVRYVKQTIANIEILAMDISIRHIGTFPEIQRRRLKEIAGQHLRDINNEIYFSAWDIHKTHKTTILMPWSYNNIYRDTYSFSHIIDILDSLEKINDVKSYKGFVNTVTGILTIKLISEKYKKLEEWLKSADKETKIVYYRASAQIEYDLVRKYIGTSFFGWLDNQLVSPMPTNVIDSKTTILSKFIDDETLSKANYIGFSLNTKIQWDMSNDYNSNEIFDIEKIHAAAVFQMFLSKHNGIFDFEEWNENKQPIELTVDYINVDFALSAFFVNICDPSIMIEFYLEIIEHAKEKGYPSNKLEILAEQLIKTVKQLYTNDTKVLGEYRIGRMTAKSIVEGIYSNKPNRSLENLKALTKIKTEGIIPMLNINLMYNIMREVRKNVKRARNNNSAWASYCEYFANIKREFSNIDKSYINVEGYSQKQLYDKYKGKVPTLDDEKSVFYLNKTERKYFDRLIQTIRWQNDTLQEDKRQDEVRKYYDKINRIDDNDFQENFR